MKTQGNRLSMFSLFNQHPNTLDELADYSIIMPEFKDNISK